MNTVDLQKILNSNNIDMDILERGILEAEKVLQVEHNSKDNINNKLLNLFSVYISILLADIGAIFAIPNDLGKYEQILCFLIIISIYFFISVICFLYGLRNTIFGYIGIEPEKFLTLDILDKNNNNNVKIMFICALNDYIKRIEVSHASNDKKMVAHHIGMYFSIIGIITAVIFSLTFPFKICCGIILGIILLILEFYFCFFISKKY